MNTNHFDLSNTDMRRLRKLAERISIVGLLSSSATRSGCTTGLGTMLDRTSMTMPVTLCRFCSKEATPIPPRMVIVKSRLPSSGIPRQKLVIDFSLGLKELGRFSCAEDPTASGAFGSTTTCGDHSVTSINMDIETKEQHET